MYLDLYVDAENGIPGDGSSCQRSNARGPRRPIGQTQYGGRCRRRVGPNCGGPVSIVKNTGQWDDKGVRRIGAARNGRRPTPERQFPGRGGLRSTGKGTRKGTRRGARRGTRRGTGTGAIGALLRTPTCSFPADASTWCSFAEYCSSASRACVSTQSTPVSAPSTQCQFLRLFPGHSCVKR